MHYYNEIDPYCAQWLRNLIDAGHLPKGHVDVRSIVDVQPDDVAGYAQAHFFAGIGGWPLALQLAGWPEDREIWTGSCPCQPFSQASKGAIGLADDRHLWPHFHRLIRVRRPAVVVGEQVASKDAEPWLDHVLADLEAVDYAGAAVAFPSSSIGAPHIRDRTYWMGYADDAGLEGLGGGHRAAQGQRQAKIRPATAASGAVRLADAGIEAPGPRRRSDGEDPSRHESGAGPRGRGAAMQQRPGPVNGPWRVADWLFGRDGKWRPVEPGTFPLVDGFSGRMERLRAYGNAINARQGAEFMRAVMECTP